MKKPSPKVLEGQQKLFSLLSGPTRLRIVQQLAVTPESTLEQLVKRTGIPHSTAYKAVKDLAAARVVDDNGEGGYSVHVMVKYELENVFVDSAHVAELLRKSKPRKTQERPMLRAVM